MLFFAKTVTYVSSLPVTYLTSLYTSAARERWIINEESGRQWSPLHSLSAQTLRTRNLLRLGVIDSSFEDLTAEQVQEIGDTCVEIANTYYGILEISEQANQDFVMFQDLFGEEYAEECQFLREWYLASSVFVEFATNPRGNRSEYSAALSEHNSIVYKFQKEAELMK